MFRNAPVSAWSPGPVPAPEVTPEVSPLILIAGDGGLDGYTFAGYRHLAVRTTAHALEALRRDRPAALVVDGDAEGVDAEAICRQAAAQGAHSLVTLAAPQLAPAMLKAGCHAILLKPFAPNLLAA